MNPSNFPNVPPDTIRDMNYHIVARFHKASTGFSITSDDYNIKSFEDLISSNRCVIKRVWKKTFGYEFSG